MYIRLHHLQTHSRPITLASHRKRANMRPALITSSSVQHGEPSMPSQLQPGPESGPYDLTRLRLTKRIDAEVKCTCLRHLRDEEWEELYIATAMSAVNKAFREPEGFEQFKPVRLLDGL